MLSINLTNRGAGEHDIISLDKVSPRKNKSKLNKVSKRKNASHILLIEDFPIIRQYLTEIFEIEGYQVTAIASGYEALDYLGKLEKFNLVFMDISLPDIHGCTVMRTFKQNCYKANFLLPIIANISTVDNPDKDLHSLCQLSGAKAIYTGGGEPAGIISLIKTCLEPVPSAVSIMDKFN